MHGSFLFSDIDECTTGSNNCAVGTATCTNIPGSFTCACNSGYSGNGVICTGEELKKCFISETLDLNHAVSAFVCGIENFSMLTGI